MGATLSLAYRGSLDPDHILHGLLSGSSDTRQVRLRSRHPFVPGAQNLLEILPDLASALLNGQTINGKWSTMKMLPGSVLLCPEPVPGLLGWAYPEQLGLSSTTCGLVLGNSIHPCTNGVSLLHRIVSDHVLALCPLHRAPHGARGLTVLDDETRCWLNNTTASI